MLPDDSCTVHLSSSVPLTKKGKMVHMMGGLGLGAYRMGNVAKNTS